MTDMTIEELNQALTDDAVYARRKMLLDALAYEMDLVDKAMTVMDAMPQQEIDMMTESQTEKYNEDRDELADAHNDLDDAHTHIFRSLSIPNINRYNEEANRERLGATP